MEPIYTTDEVASLLKIETAVVQNLIDTGRLNVVRLGNQVRVRERDLNRCLEENTSSNEIVEESGHRLCSTFAGRTEFRVKGSVEEGARIWCGKARYPTKCSKEFFEGLLREHRGRTLKVGLSFSDPGEGTLGAYVRQELNTFMNPTAYIAGLLVEEGYAERPERGYIRFFNRRQGGSK